MHHNFIVLFRFSYHIIFELYFIFILKVLVIIFKHFTKLAWVNNEEVVVISMCRYLTAVVSFESSNLDLYVRLLFDDGNLFGFKSAS